MADVLEITTPTEWFDLLYARCAGWLSLFSIDRGTGERHIDWAPVADRGILADAAESRAVTCDVWFGVATRRERLNGGRRGGAPDCLELPALYADFDVAGPNHPAIDTLPKTVDEAKTLLADFGVPATAIVYTGGGIQPYWLLDEPLSADEARRVLARWRYTWASLAEKRGVHVDDVFDLARVLRVPGTCNRKHEPVAVHARARADRRYVVAALDAQLADPPPRTANANGKAPYTGGTRPGDAFNAAHGGGDVLALRGFVPTREDAGGDQHWRYPEAGSDTSATVYAEDGHTTVWSETVAGKYPAVELRRPYDPFGLYTVLFCDGDFSRATQDVSDQGYGQHDIFDLGWLRARRNGDTADPASASMLVLVPASSIKIDRPRWVWDQRIPVGGTTLLPGKEGLGKTAFVGHLAARISRGDLAGEWQGRPGHVVYVGCEDDRSTVLVPRLVAADADLTRFHFVDIPNGGSFTVSVDTGHLRDAILAADLDVALIVVDPLDSHLGHVDSHRKAEVQAAIQQLAELAQELRCGALGLAHLNKSDVKDLLARVVGSVGFTTSVRAVLGIGEHPDNPTERVCVLGKANMTDKTIVSAIRFRVDGTTVPHPDGGLPINTARVVILGEEPGIDPDSIITGSCEERSVLEEAVAWLKSALSDGAMPYAELRKLAAGEGIGTTTLWRAKRREYQINGVTGLA